MLWSSRAGQRLSSGRRILQQPERGRDGGPSGRWCVHAARCVLEDPSALQVDHHKGGGVRPALRGTRTRTAAPVSASCAAPVAVVVSAGVASASGGISRSGSGGSGCSDGSSSGGGGGGGCGSCSSGSGSAQRVSAGCAHAPRADRCSRVRRQPSGRWRVAGDGSGPTGWRSPPRMRPRLLRPRLLPHLLPHLLHQAHSPVPTQGRGRAPGPNTMHAPQ
jgi:hypothetical protein